LLNASEVSIRFLLTRAHKRGDIEKLRRGLCALPDKMPSVLEIANALVRPSYVSFHYAMAYHHLIPEAVCRVASATTRNTRRFQFGGTEYSYHHLKPAAFTAHHPEQVGGRTVLIAEPEKAFLDSLYLATLRRLALPERLDVRALNRKKLVELARLFGREELMAALEEYR
jgi:predicted transcriptional regulator of viral defense system